MEEKVFVGYNFGKFQADDGAMRDYCNVFVIEEHGGQENADYHFGGQKSAKYKCVGPEVFKDIQPGTRVQCYFDSYRRVSYMVPVKKG